MRRVAAILLVLAVFGGCSVLRKQDRAIVGNAAAAQRYHADRYLRLCVAVKGPPGCAQMKQDLEAWAHLNDIANDVQLIGEAPKEEKKELQAMWDKVKTEP